MIEAHVDAKSLDRFNAVWATYLQYRKRDLGLILAEKGRDLGIKLFQGYRGVAPAKGFARIGLAERTRAGKGTLVRESIRRDPNVNQRTRGKKGRVVNRHRARVGREIATRERGRGALAAGFLWFRNRRDKQSLKGVRQVRNRTGSTIGRAVVGEDSFQILGYTIGLSLIDRRYGIVRGALRRSAKSMTEYIEGKKQKEWANDIRRRIREIGLPVT